MDVYSQLQEKLDDLSHRFAHEARYFQVCAPPRAEGSEKVHDPIEEPPFPETAESLAQRAQVSAHAIVALNVQVEQLLGMLPGDDSGEEEQMRILQELVRENEEAGAAVRREREKVEEVLGKVRGVMGDVCEKKGDPEIRAEWCRMARDPSLAGAAGDLHPAAAKPPDAAAVAAPGAAVTVKMEQQPGGGMDVDGAGVAGGAAVAAKAEPADEEKAEEAEGGGMMDVMMVDRPDVPEHAAPPPEAPDAPTAGEVVVKEEVVVKPEVVDITDDAALDVKAEDDADSLLLG